MSDPDEIDPVGRPAHRSRVRFGAWDARPGIPRCHCGRPSRYMHGGSAWCMPCKGAVNETCECSAKQPTEGEMAMNATATACECIDPDALCDDCLSYAAEDAEPQP